MNKLKKFITFVNEELNPETYRKAGEKLKEKGHKTRGENLIDYGKSNIKGEISYKKDTETDEMDVHLKDIEINFSQTKLTLRDLKRNEVFFMAFIELSTKYNIRFIETSFTYLVDRKDARMVYKLIMNYFNSKGRNLKNFSVNDLYAPDTIINPRIVIDYHDDGKKKSETWYLTGKHQIEHREDGPAYQEWYDDGQKGIETWFLNGKRHREDGPAHQLWDIYGKISIIEWRINGEYHKKDGPAVKRWYYDKQIGFRTDQLGTEEWWVNGKLHREDGPAKLDWYSNGKKEIEKWYLNDKLHREDGPAYQFWYENGQKRSAAWFLNGELHREDGPALQQWVYNGEKIVEEWWLNGKKYSKRKWNRMIKK